MIMFSIGAGIVLPLAILIASSILQSSDIPQPDV